MNEQLKKRLLSFAWRFGSYIAVSALAFIAENIGLLELNPTATTIIALVCGEITKYINTGRK